MRFEARLRAVTSDGAVTVDRDGLRVPRRDRVLLILANRDELHGFDISPPSPAGIPRRSCAMPSSSPGARHGTSSGPRTSTDHRGAHRSRHPYSSPCWRDDVRPTKHTGAGTKDPAPGELLFALRTLFAAASSRPGTQPPPAGIWNDQVRPPWSSNHTLNINAEMNYWPVETATWPSSRAAAELNRGPRGDRAKTARTNYGGRRLGRAHHNSRDIGRQSAAVGRLRRRAISRLGLVVREPSLRAVVRARRLRAGHRESAMKFAAARGARPGWAVSTGQ